ncbi:DUF6106 family protein [Roseburia hominis]
MGDYYTEQLVKRKTPASAYVIMGGLALMTTIAVLAMLLFPFGILIVVIAGVIDYFVFRGLNVEYEYLYVNGNLDIDKIMSKSKRKRIFEMAINDMELIAPKGAAQLHGFQNIKATDFSSGMSDARLYEMIVVKSGAKQRIVFEPDDVILEGMRMLAPRKVIK